MSKFKEREIWIDVNLEIELESQMKRPIVST